MKIRGTFLLTTENRLPTFRLEDDGTKCTENDRRRYLVFPYNTNYRGCVTQAMTIAVHHSILCHHIRNCSSGPSAGRHTSEIKWHAALQKNGALEMGPL